MQSFKFCLLAFFVAVIAFFLNAFGYDQLDKGCSLDAQAIKTAYQQHIKYVRDAEATRLYDHGAVLRMWSMAFTIIGFVCMLIAMARKERGWYLLLLFFLCLDAIALMIP